MYKVAHVLNCVWADSSQYGMHASCNAALHAKPEGEGIVNSSESQLVTCDKLTA